MNDLPVFEIQQNINAGTKWTSEQQTAITLKGGRILVSAAAGSGKTAVLTERVIRLIKSGNDISRFLIVTFTVSAANEMRSRIREALQKELEKEPNNRHIQRQSLLVGRAKICTIDSFCGEIVRKNFQLAGVSPDYRVCTAADDELIKREALTRVFEECYTGNDADFIKGVRLFSGSKNDEKFFNLIFDLINWLYSLPYPAGAMEHFCSMWDPEGKYSNMYESPWYRVAEDHIRSVIEGHVNKYEYALNRMSMQEGFEKYIEIFEAEEQMLKNVLASEDPESFCENLCAVFFKTLSAARGVDTVTRDSVKAVRDKCKADINRFRNETLSETPDQYKEDLQSFYPVLCNISKIICNFFTIQQEIKNERNCLSFSDVSSAALRLLVSSYNHSNGKYEITALANEISEEYDFVMLDEYQDTNMLQNLIFESVSQSGSKLFCVGDVKQSIYRFRRAMPQLFLNRLLTAKEAGQGFPAVARLSKNFRSSQGVIDFVNFFFSKMMSRSGAEIEYDDTHKLNLGAQYPANDYTTKIDIILSDKEASDDLAGEEDRKAYAQGRACAKEIKKLLNENRQVYDAKTKNLRPLKLKDIVILMRSVKNRARGYVAALKDEGIDVYCDASASFYENYEVLFFTAFLEAIDNPYNDLSLAAALRSPMYNFSVQELTDIREANDKVSLFDCLCLLSNENEKAKNAVDSINKYRALSSNLPVYRLIWQVLSDFSMFELVSALGQGSKRIDNLKKIYLQAKDYENSALKGLYGFLRFIEKVREQSNDTDNSNSAPSTDHVHITTIHKSKGLEYPVVFICGSDVEFRTDDIRSRIVTHDTLGIGCTLRDFSDNTDYVTLQREAVSIQLRKEMVAEEMRLLYVAMTRAKEKLYIILYNEGDFSKRLNNIAGEITNEIKAPAAFVNSSRCSMDWILFSLLTHPCFNEIKNKFDVPVASKSSNVKIETECFDIDTLSQVTSFYNSKQTQNNMDDFAQILNFEYTYPELSNIPAKVSVSELKGIRPADEDGAPLLKSFAFNSVPNLKGTLKATERGTAFHRFMQYIDLYEPDIKKQAMALFEQGILTREEMLSLPFSELSVFYESSIAENMRKARKVYREYRFLSDIPSRSYNRSLDEDCNEPILIQGVIDMFYEDEDGNIVLVDYKSDRNTTEEYYIENYSSQLHLYAEALGKILNKKVSRCLVYALALGKSIEL